MIQLVVIIASPVIVAILEQDLVSQAVVAHLGAKSRCDAMVYTALTAVVPFVRLTA
jgi:hypothetical protein